MSGLQSLEYQLRGTSPAELQVAGEKALGLIPRLLRGPVRRLFGPRARAPLGPRS